MRLLVVEDEIYLLDILKKRLQKEHYSVDACEDGEEAWDYIRVTQYDGIVLDIMLPGIDGIEILRRMRKEGNHTPVLLLTKLAVKVASAVNSAAAMASVSA